MNNSTSDWIQTGLRWLAEANVIAKIITDSSMEKLSEAAIPGLATIAADIRAIEGGIDMIENISPSIQHALTIVQILSNGVNMTPEETAKLRQDRIDENNKTGG